MIASSEAFAHSLGAGFKPAILDNCWDGTELREHSGKTTETLINHLDLGGCRGTHEMVSQPMKQQAGQQTFADLEHAHKKKVTRREKFLSEMDAVIPWARL